MTTWTECVMSPVWREPDTVMGAFQRNPGQLTYINGHVRYAEYQDLAVLPRFRKDAKPVFAMHCTEAPLAEIRRVRWRASKLSGAAVEFNTGGRWYELYFLPPAGYRLSDTASGIETRPMARILQAARYVHHVGGLANMASRALVTGDHRASRAQSDANASLWRAILSGTVPGSIRTADSTHEAGVRAAIGQLGHQIEDPTLAGLHQILTADATAHLRQPIDVISRGLAEDAAEVRGLPAIYSAMLALRSHEVHVRRYDARRSTLAPADGSYWATLCPAIQPGRGAQESFACISCAVASTRDGWRINSVLLDTDKTAREVLRAIFRTAAGTS